MDEQLKNNTYRILELFMYQPNKDFSARGIARELKLSHVTIISHIKNIQKLGLIRKKENTLYPTYYANTESENMRFYKKNAIIFALNEIGVIDYIKKRALPSSVVLFGSCAKGIYTEKSDIDIFVEAKKTKLDLARFEKSLKRHINVLFEGKIASLSMELRNNILNGAILYGFIKI